MNKTPPKYLLRFFRWFCHPDYVEDIEGDLLERFDKRPSKWIFTWEVVKLLRPGIIKRLQGTYRMNQYDLLKHYFKITIRNIAKHKLHTAISMFGLIIGLASSLIIFKYVGFETTIDNFHRENIYQVVLVEEKNSGQTISEQCYWEIGEIIRQKFQGVQLVTQMGGPSAELLISYEKEDGKVKHNETGIFTVDSSFLNMFSFEPIHGNIRSAFFEPDQIVLTETIAKKFFGDKNPVGEFLTTESSWGRVDRWKIAAVLIDPPLNSNLKFNFLKSYPKNRNDTSWEFPFYSTYVLIDPNKNLNQIEYKLNQFLSEDSYLAENDRKVSIKLESLARGDLSPFSKMLLAVGVFILIISWINLINLSTGRYILRSREVRLRKVFGASRNRLIHQFIFESFLENIMAFLLALGLSSILYQWVNPFVSYNILPLIKDPTNVNLYFFALFFVGTFCSTAYPAIIVSNYSPANAIYERLKIKRSTFRSALIIVQFAIALVLLVGISVIWRQLDYMQNQNLSINLERTIMVKSAKASDLKKSEKFNDFKARVTSYSMIEGVASASTVPGEEYRHEVYYQRSENEEKVMMFVNAISANFFDLFDVDFIAGTGFKDRNWKNRKSIIINEEATKLLGYERPDLALNTKIYDLENKGWYDVIGIIKNYHKTSLEHKIKPMAFRSNEKWGNIALKIKSNNYTTSSDLEFLIASLKDDWDEVYPDHPFNYYFLDEKFNAQYISDIRFRKIFVSFSITSLCIACFGLVGLSVFISLRRKKETGIRKVHGATLMNIVFLLGKDYATKISLAVVVGLPFAFYFTQDWLSNYSYQAPMSIWPFVYSCVALFIIGLLTISYQTIKTSLLNPVNSLKDE